MKQGLNIDTPSLSTHLLRMIPFGSENVMSTGTGFIYEDKDEFFLITNGHNVTRTNPQQTQRIIKSAAFPVKINIKVRFLSDEKPNMIGLSDFHSINLYDDEHFKKPNWFVHPDKKYLIDVIAIPLIKKEKTPSHFKFFPINNFSFDKEYGLEVADDLFILGYPFNLTGGNELPIWKRGTLASEPFIEMDNLPKMFVDTATQSGMSGSPVIMQRIGIHGMNNGKLKGDSLIGRIRNFVGIYSGRIGADNEFKAQLGIVWKERVINEILSAKIKGGIEFQQI